MKKSIFVIFALVGLMLTSSCSYFQTKKEVTDLPTVYAPGYDTSFHDEFQAYKQVNTSYTSCKTGKQVPYQKDVKDGIKSFDHSVKVQGPKIEQDAFLSMLAKAGFVKETDTWLTLPWSWLQWLLFIALFLALGMIAWWILRRLLHAINAPLPPYVVYQQPVQYVQPPVAPAPQPTSVAPANPAPAPAPAVESSAPISTAAPVASGPTIINNYAGGIIVQMASGGNQPAPGFTKKSTKFDFSVKGSFDEEWS